MIPKNLHFVWIGPNDIPIQEQRYIQSWKDFHKSWNIFIWNNKNLNLLNINPICLQAIENLSGLYACQADIIRYIAVNTYGGVYSDTDIECFRSIDNILDNTFNFIGLRPHAGNWITNAFFASTSNNKLLEYAINHITDKKHKSKNPYGPNYITMCLRKTYNYPNGIIDQIKNDQCKVLSSDFWNIKKSNYYCRHYFRASWRKK